MCGITEFTEQKILSTIIFTLSHLYRLICYEEHTFEEMCKQQYSFYDCN
jgi:hypothetical protein